METLTVARHTIVEQLPLFLQRRRRKWTGLQALLDENRLTRPTFSLLRAVEGETLRGQSLTLQQMQEHLFNPYATRFEIFEQLPFLVERGYLQQWDGGYLVTDAGRGVVDQIEIAARRYMGMLQVTTLVDLSALAVELVDLVHRSWQAPEPLIKAHQARTQRRLSVEEAPALVQIEWAILGLWEARDDAHMAAWRAYRFSGPTFDILTRIWSKEAQTLSSLIATLEDSQQPADIQRGILDLREAGYIIEADDQVELTAQGQQVRDDIEGETDRIFFASWGQIADEKVIWLCEQMSELCVSFKE